MRVSSAFVDLRRTPGPLQSPGYSFTAGPLRRGASSFHHEPDSLQSFWPPPNGPTITAGTRLPWSLFALQRHTRASPIWSGLSNPAPAPLSGFLNLTAGYSSNRLEVLFHTSNTLGISPSRVFPSQTAHCLVNNDSPPSITTTQPTASCLKSLLSAIDPKNDCWQPGDCFQGFYPSESPFTPTHGVTQAWRPILS